MIKHEDSPGVVKGARVTFQSTKDGVAFNAKPVTIQSSKYESITIIESLDDKSVCILFCHFCVDSIVCDRLLSNCSVMAPIHAQRVLFGQKIPQMSSLISKMAVHLDGMRTISSHFMDPIIRKHPLSHSLVCVCHSKKSVCLFAQQLMGHPR